MSSAKSEYWTVTRYAMWCAETNYPQLRISILRDHREALKVFSRLRGLPDYTRPQCGPRVYCQGDW